MTTPSNSEADGSARRSATGPRESRDRGPSGGEEREGYVCAFWLGGTCFGITARAVREVVSAGRIADVPLAPPSLVGIFNLRGEPIALVDLSDALGIPRAASPRRAAASDESVPALLLKSDDLTAAIRIDAMDGVVALRDGTTIVPAQDVDPLVDGFLPGKGKGGATVTVLNAEKVLGELRKLKFR